MGKETEALNIRAWEPQDLPAVGFVDLDCFQSPWSLNMLLDEYCNSLTTYLVLEEAGRIIGYAGFWLVAGEAQITRVAIRRDERGRGLGKMLFQTLLERAWAMGASAITLEVRESNAAARGLYAACGFREAGVRPRYYEAEHEDAVIMWLYKAV